MASTSQTPTGFNIPGWALTVIVTVITNIVTFSFYTGKQDGRITSVEQAQVKIEKRMDAYDAHRQEELAGYEKEYKQRTQSEVAQMQVLIKNLLELQAAKNSAK